MIEVLLGLCLAVIGIIIGAFSIDVHTTAWRVRFSNLFRVSVVAAGVAIATGAIPLTYPRASLEWRTDLENALAEARANKKPAILDASAEWCGACKELERRTFSDPDVAEALKGYIKIRVDMTRFDEAQERLSRLGIHINSLPWVGFFLPDGRLNPGVILTDFESPSQFLNRVEQAQTYREAPLTPVEVWLGEHGLIVALMLVFLAGIGVSLTPCVYPMIPTTIAVIGGAAGITFSQRALRSALFVLGMFITYVTLGIMTAALGKGFGSWLQSPFVTIGMGALFVAMAVSYLGFFSLDLPSSVKTFVGRGRRGLIGIVMIGMGTGLLAAPCAGPVVVGVLALIGSTGDIEVGMALMAAFASGMALFFFIIGLSSELLVRLRRTGAGTSKVEVVLAIALLVVAAYYLRLGITTLV